jgi:hypothetical protein
MFKALPMASGKLGQDAAVRGTVNGILPKSSEKFPWLQSVSSSIDNRVGVSFLWEVLRYRPQTRFGGFLFGGCQLRAPARLSLTNAVI